MQELLELRELTSHAQKKGDIEDDLVQNMINTESTLNDRMGQSELRLFSGSKPSSAELNQGGGEREILNSPFRGNVSILVPPPVTLSSKYEVLLKVEGEGEPQLGGHQCEAGRGAGQDRGLQLV